MDNYRDFQVKKSPPWLQGPFGKKLQRVLGNIKDLTALGAIDAIKCRFASECPDDALSLVASNHSIDKYPSDTLAGFRQRIVDAWDTWELAGTRQTIIKEFKTFLSSANVRIIANRDWGSPPDNDENNWSRFWVVIDSSPWVVDLWGDPGVWGDGGTWGSSATIEDIDTLKKIANKWKPSETIAFILLCLGNGDFWGPDSPWENGFWGDTVVLIFSTK